MVCILAIIKHVIPLKVYEPEPISPTYSLHNKNFSVLSNITLLVSPNDTRTQNVMDIVKNLLNVQYRIYKTSDDALTAYEKSTYNDIGVIFDFNKSETSFAIRANYDHIASTLLKDLFTPKSKCRDSTDNQAIKLRHWCKTNSYLYTGFSVLQTAISTAFIQLDTNATNLSLPDISVQQLPRREYTTDTSYIQILSSIYFVMSFAPLISLLTLNLVTEKEKKIKEGMRMMGMRDSAFWCAWTTVYAAEILFIVLVMLVVSYAGSFFSRESNYFIFFLMLFLYGMSIINMAFLLVPFFKKATAASAFASLFPTVLSLLYLAVSLTRTYTGEGFEYSIPVYGRWLLCLISPASFALAIDQGLFLDIWKNGMTFSNLTHGDFPLYAPIIMLFIDVILYGFLAVYLDNVIPGEYGHRRSPIFCFKPSFWSNPKAPNRMAASYKTDQNQGADVELIHEDFVGKEGIQLVKEGIQINNITKVFKKDGKDVPVVDGLSLTMYEGQITALLGHNGAGKTTLINMLVGLTPVTGGDAWIQGLNVTDTNNMDVIRSKTGVCPQHNLLLDDLTCKEHLQIFAGFKGVAHNYICSSVTDALRSVDLTDKADTLAKNLSGGQKRKLSVAIALIGDPKILIFDEPTAGMDPFSRRTLWSLLQSKKEGRIILLTTHFMDEADILADRKAIISQGKLRCCGSSLFLKSRFGIGYHLNMVVQSECDIDKVTEFLKTFADQMTFVRSHGNELSYTLPFQNVSAFAALFVELESAAKPSGPTRAQSLGIDSYGVSMTTLEEVFLKLAQDDTILGSGSIVEPLKPSSNEGSPYRTSSNQVSPQKQPLSVNDGLIHTDNQSNREFMAMPRSVVITGGELRKQRFWAMLRLRFLLAVNNPLALVFVLVMPAIFIIIGVLFNKLAKVESDAHAPSALNMNLALGAYADLIHYPQGRGPPMLFHDSSSGPNVEYMYKAMASFINLTKFDNKTDFLNIGQHYLGVDVSALQEVNPTDYTLSFKTLYNFTATHAIPVMINQMMNNLAGFIKRGSPDLIQVFSLPWNSTNARPVGFNNNVFSSTIIVAMAFIVIAPGFGFIIIVDKECKARALLRVSGITVTMYWLSMYTYCALSYLIPVVLSVIVILAAQLPAFYSAPAMITLILSLLLYMSPAILTSFSFSFLFSKAETAMSVTPNIFIMSSLLPYIAISLVDMIADAQVASHIHIIFCCIDPPYIIFGAIYYIDKVYRLAEINKLTLTFSDYYTGPTGINITIAFVTCIFHTIWLALLLRLLEVTSTGGNVKDTCRCGDELRSVSRVTVASDNRDIIEGEDSDVREERGKVGEWITHGSQDGVVMVNNLRKEFKAKEQSCQSCRKKEESDVNIAVRNASFGVPQGEVFGLLGPNGAGKTTILNMIMADIGPTCGSVHIAGYDVQSSLSKAYQALGVCPQHDALWELLTLRQHLTTYALIEGIPREDVNAKITYFMDSMNLGEHADKKAKALSGGTKRKLSFAISMMGEPKIVLMDEPSTGMDPQSKRFFWDTIGASFQGTDRGAILTTHYMEEADALCSRVAIMVNGQIQCLGSTQHLKDKYGSGYILEIKVTTTADMQLSLDRLNAFVLTNFDDASCTERFGDRLVYKVPQSSVGSLGKAFEVLENGKQTHNISEYSFSQSSLEQVFLEFAKAQLDEGVKTE